MRNQAQCVRSIRCRCWQATELRYFLLRQPRSNGSRHACGATSWWIEFGPTSQERTGAPEADLATAAQTVPAFDAFGGCEERVIIAHGIQDQPLVRLENLAYPIGLVRWNCMLSLSSFMPGPGRLP